MTIREKLATTVDWQAEWREHKAEEYPEDPRNGLAAQTLRALAGYIRALDDSDPRLVGFQAFTDEGLDHVVLGPETHYFLSRIGGFEPGGGLAEIFDQLSERAHEEEVHQELEELESRLEDLEGPSTGDGGQ